MASPLPPVFADEPTSAAAENLDSVVDKTTELSLKAEDIDSKKALE